jgi:alginate O-acetyltransferase complex protein AlgI
MIFSSYEFLFLFLPVVLALYYLLPGRQRIFFLTLASYFFYGWWDFRFCGLMLISTLIDYLAGLGISRAETLAGRKKWMVVSVISNLSLLGFFKYFDMFATTLNFGLSSVLNPSFSIPNLHLVLPVGISFYTFQSMSYAIDLYRGHARPTRSFMDFACYVSLFPQLVAGPIVRYHELAAQLVERKHTVAKVARGVAIFIVGLAKKILVADGVASLTVLAFGEPAPSLGQAWLGVLAYAMQIYFDFSGYSDMAIGLGLMLGFQFPINFNSPYQAVSITDFWRRWHISLSNWLRDYLYIPLGGNRLGARRTYINLALVMLLGGLWHGANWTFVVWGRTSWHMAGVGKVSRLRRTPPGRLGKAANLRSGLPGLGSFPVRQHEPSVGCLGGHVGAEWGGLVPRQGTGPAPLGPAGAFGHGLGYSFFCFE